MRKIVALLLTVAMVLSLIPAQLVSAQTPAGAAFSRSFTPRRAAASPFMMFSDIVAPQVTSPASIDVLDATGQHWVRSTDAADGTYVAAQAVYSVVFDGFNFTSPVAIGLGVEPSRQNISGPRYAYVPATIAMNPAFQHLDWEGRLYPSPALDGTGVLMVEFVALNASWMAGPRDVTITAPFYTEDGTSYDITIDFVLDLNPPSAIPSMTVANAQGTMFTGSQNSVSFNITTAGIPSGSHELAWFVTTAAGTQAQNVPGVTLPATLNVAANGSATLTLTGTPTTAGTWYIHPAIPVAGSYGLYAYHFIRLTVQHPPTGGGGGGGGGGGQQQQPPAQQPPAQPPAQPPGNTTNVIINNVNKVVVNTNVTNTVIVNVINEARQKGERPVVEIELD
ncbi:MAG: hypothetical protein FWC89_06065, partial [Defluviitaleaceae bacterium]|nr:hypothetical protein [Defluviitaleaceae bacterium]